jgi:hypothetical protein
MQGALIALIASWALLSVGSTLVAAPEQGPRPGEMNPPNVWVQNRGPSEAIPVSLYEPDPGSPLRVQVAGTTAARVDNIVATRSVPQIWDYREVRIPADQDAASVLSNAGADGWETTGLQFPAAGAVMVIMKRPRSGGF